MSQNFEVEYLSTFLLSSDPLPQISGICFGPNYRLFVRVVIVNPNNKNARNVFCLVDTGSPSTFLTDECFAHLGIDTSNFRSGTIITLKIHGFVMSASLSHGHFSDVCMLGADFLVVALFQTHNSRNVPRTRLP
eukprot:c8397_g1_i4.p1 GENE.c8397_g1_i4~~c8397_g1_i4.p1  ORF type:complete len:134 (-),score=16.75 c8397_g1_i4:260-661(-)